MSAPALARQAVAADPGTAYPVLLPTLRDPRLHLAAVIISLQVLGQTVFGFDLSIAQILVSLVTCAVLEVGITFRRQHVVMWPASALLTGNGVAFILRVPGTEHGDWWSMNGWWIFAGTAAVVAALEVPDPVPRAATSSTPRTSGSSSASCCSARSRRPARLLVGADVALARARARDHRRRRLRDPAAAAAAATSPSPSGSRSPRASACSRRAATR